MITVTISRQFGCGGSYVGERLAKRLGFKYADRGILRLAAKRLGVPPKELAGKEGRISGFWEDFFRGFSFGAPDAGYYVPPPVKLVGDEEFFEAESQIIKWIPSRYSAVIMGRGAYDILAGSPGLVNIFLHAPLDFRARRVMELYKIQDRKEAVALIEEKDKERARFLLSVTGKVWTDACNFQLCLDTAQAGFDLAEETAAKLVEGLPGRKPAKK